ncbi:MAG: hypothetical protein L3K26_19535 [Candidatus Hydrogenedentes bacterium]|nr:hypothetical protein [Candidatus Hydrogenedentota bacterium]
MLNAFATLDTDNDGSLSFSEASQGLSALSNADFNVLDENGDGQLTQSELNAAVGTTGGFGCIALAESRFEEYFGDIILLILAALTLVTYSPIAQSGFGK